MQLTRGIHNLPINGQNGGEKESRGCVLTIGNFDGVHLGHQQVISALIQKAESLNCEAAVLVFEPQPQELFSPESAPARLSRLRDKYILLKNLGVDRLICINFNKKFASLRADTFIDELLVQRLGIKHLIVGDDFRFGKNRQGNFSMLKDAGNVFGFNVTDTKSHKLADCRVSSTEVRRLLERDDLAAAKEMLGRPYSIMGKVFHGDKRGREMGFPTANIRLKRRVSPVSGVYAVKINREKSTHFGVANIGSRPTVAGIRQQLEVHIFDFEHNVYGETIEVVLLEKLRNEQRFASLDELTTQIKLDTEQARTFVQNLS